MNPATTTDTAIEPTVLDAAELTSAPERGARSAGSAHRFLADPVGGGAALGWVDEYGRLPDFVAVGERRYDRVFCTLDFRRQG
ncbi:hypothetical protein [Streptomyces sp. NPDC014734]|uniref:hypothetical protein n=1 Tax=Streptomyces sp. NPDC014734 TaxID=3364886 RepID=UPI0036F5B1F5